MHLIIDGYNLIRQSPVLKQLDARDLEAGRAALLERLADYRRLRTHLALTVVFDGWQAGGPTETRDLYRGVRVIYSRRGERADEVIKRLVSRERQRALVVSSDRELQAWAAHFGAAWASASEFDLLSSRLATGELEEPEAEEARPWGTAKKGPAKRRSKRERQRQQRLRKL